VSGSVIRACGDADRGAILAVVNDAARAYRGVIPADRWHEPYMSAAELAGEIAAGVRFWGCEDGGELIGVMGIQDRGEVDLIRHAYVKTSRRRRGAGARLLAHIETLSAKPILIGTWAAASWAIAFYEKHGYRVLSRDDTERLLRRYWSVPERQIATSVVLASARWDPGGKAPGTRMAR
jgi:GNAT superfamily N-acetyltransferase